VLWLAGALDDGGAAALSASVTRIAAR
jgi:hypothetical protein